MVNYVLSFCKITGASRIFSRHFYLPLLKPQTPKEALRTLRITGKWLLGAKIQHYIPVLLNHARKRSEKEKDYGKKIHTELEDFNYMCPVIDPDNENHKILTKLLETKKGDGVFVYTVADKKYNIILQAQFELAIRDGDIIDLLVSQKNDKIIVKLKDFKKIPMEIQYYDSTAELYCGEGATSPEEEQFHHHGKWTMSLAKIFEDKERLEEEWEEHLRRLIKRRKKQKGEGTKEWKQMVKESMKNLDWKKFEEDAKKIIDEISEPATEEDIVMEIDDLEKTKGVNETILRKGDELLKQLPSLSEIPDIIKSMANATLCEIEDYGDGLKPPGTDKRRLSGVKITLSSGKECFISGQMVHTETGDVFVPGQTIENEFGLEYAPGITINIDNQPTLISGLIMGEEERPPMFLPTESTITADGQLTFAANPEERPKIEPEKRKPRRKKVKAEVINATNPEMTQENIMDNSIVLDSAEINEKAEEEQSEEEEVTTEESMLDNSDDSEEKSSVELNNSEIEELDIEAIRLKQEQQRLELERLKQILLDDGMDDLIASLEEKKAKLKQRLEEMRRLSVSQENNLISYVSEADALDIAARISNNTETINRMVEILLTVTRRASTFRDKNNVNADNIHQPSKMFECLTETDGKFNRCSNKLKILLKTSVVAANEVFKNRPKDQVLAFNSMSEIIVDVLNKDEKILEELLEIMNTPMERNELCNTLYRQLTQNISKSKTFLLQEVIDQSVPEMKMQDNIISLLDKENEQMSSALEKLLKLDTKYMQTLVNNLKICSKRINDNTAGKVLEDCIASTVKAISEQKLKDFAETGSEEKITELIKEANSFAQALDLTSVSENLTNTKSKKAMKLQLYDKPTTELLKRVILIRQLAERDYSLKTAIARIKKDPERARSDPRIRQLIRESAILNPNIQELRTARDIPLQIMKKQNLLAIEDFIVHRCKLNFPVLISRGNLQAVIPKEAARSVLAGRIPYVLIDETGITNFKPMHMLSAIKVNQNREKRYEDYLNIGGNREKSAEKDENRAYLQAKTNVRKLKKLFNDRSVA